MIVNKVIVGIVKNERTLKESFLEKISIDAKTVLITIMMLAKAVLQPIAIHHIISEAEVSLYSFGCKF